MENKQYPEQEPLEQENLLSVEEPSAAEPPVIEELHFETEPAPVLIPEEEVPQEEAADQPEEDPAEQMEADPRQETESVIVPAGDDFMSRIPDVEEDCAEETEAGPEKDEVLQSVLDIVNDPEFAAPAVQKPAVEEVNDQEYRDAAPAKPLSDNGLPFQQWATRKGRPKRKKGEGLLGIPNILATFVWLALILAIGVTLGRMLWVCAADVLAFGREDRQVTITVYEADTMEDIVDKLHSNGLIRYKSLFNLYASISDAEEDIKPGIYDLNTRYDYHALVNFMSPSSTRSVIELTIPEGYTCRQIFDLLEENRVCTAQDIAVYAANGELSEYWFLDGLERGSEYCLEGYLFPDTYQFYKNSSPREALEKMLDNFEVKFSDEMLAQLDTLNAEVTGGGFDLNNVVIVASLIEKESAAASESPNIAGVIYNRLYNWEYPALLNIDAAIIYAQGGEADVIDTKLDSPYNTYRYTGLTPTAIANPGLSSLQAALNPASHDYYYYVLNPATGRHQFSTTQAEHDGWIREFYGG